MQFQVNSYIWLKPLHKKGKIREINTQDETVIISYFSESNQLRKNIFKLDDIEPLRSRKPRQALEIKVKYFDPDMPRIEKTEKGDWLDLRSTDRFEIKKGEFKLIPLGVAMELPRNYEAYVIPRSSTYKNFRVLQTNGKGLIDEIYKGDNDQWFMPVLAMEDTVIEKYDRICQFRIERKMPNNVTITEVSVLGNVDRQGHGSTGTK